MKSIRIILALSIIFSLSKVAIHGQTSDNKESNVFGSRDEIPFSLTGDIYYLKRGTRMLPKNFDKERSKGQIHTNALNITPRSFKRGFPGISKRNEWFAIDYHGFFYIHETQVLVFLLQSDDGSRLVIDDLLVIDHDGQHGASKKYGKIKLEQGIHKLNLSYFQGPKTELALVLAYKEKDGKNYKVFNFEDFSPVKIENPALDKISTIEEDPFEEENDSLIFTVEINGQVLFESNQWQIKPEAQVVLDEIYNAYLHNKPNKQLIIEGHTDDMGSDEYNMNLSKQRAQSVANYLEGNHKITYPIPIIAYGESKPILENLNDKSRAMNRRVEVQIMDSSLIQGYLQEHQVSESSMQKTE